jgi:hypothetical protein
MVWTRDQQSTSMSVADVRVWSAKPAEVQKIVFESKSRSVVLESKNDEVGRWFEGTVTRQQMPRPKQDKQEADATNHDPDTSAVDNKGEENGMLTVFPVLSVTTAERIAEAVAPLRAIREVGHLSPDQRQDFGLAEPEGMLILTIAGVERKLEVGGVAPGGADRYIRNPDTDISYAIRGEFCRDLLSGESMLNERELHGFEEDEIKRVRIDANGKSREILRAGAGMTASWTDASTPDKPDESLAAWMAKVARLRPTEYLMAPPAQAVPIMRLELFGKKDSLGFLELLRLPDEKAGYVVRTEYTRKHAKVFPSAGEQVEQELDSLLRQ